MAKVTISADITLSTQQLMLAAAQLNTDELEAFFTSIGELLKQRQHDNSTVAMRSFTQSKDQQNTDNDTDAASAIPVVESLIPRSITLDGSDVSL